MEGCRLSDSSRTWDINPLTNCWASDRVPRPAGFGAAFAHFQHELQAGQLLADLIVQLVGDVAPFGFLDLHQFFG